MLAVTLRNSYWAAAMPPFAPSETRSGATEGLAVGAAVGLEGLAVGAAVGLEGLAVGDAVGLAVGLVGDAVPVLPHTNPGLYCAAVFHACELIGVLHRALLPLPLAVYIHRPFHRVFTDDQPLGK